LILTFSPWNAVIPLGRQHGLANMSLLSRDLPSSAQV
jgi:hypothetical protein